MKKLILALLAMQGAQAQTVAPTPQPVRLLFGIGVSGGGDKLAHLDIPSELFLAPVDGSSIRSIFTTSDDVVPSWSPDSTRLASGGADTLAHLWKAPSACRR